MRNADEIMEYGRYWISYFVMNLNAKQENIRLGNLSLEQKKTLLHEYIHFYQEFSIFGMTRFVSRQQRLREAVLHLNNECFARLPLDVDEVTSKETRVNFILQNAVGTYFDKITKIHFDDLQNYQVIIGDRGDLNARHHWSGIDFSKIERVSLVHTSTEKVIHLGAIDILESMARLVESTVYPEDFGYARKVYELPYDSAMILTYLYYPELVKQKASILLMCEMALDTSNPISAFYNILLNLSSKKISDHDQVTEYLIGMKYTDGLSWLENKSRFEKKFIEESKDLLSPMLYKTIEHFFDEINKSRNSSISFFSDGLLLNDTAIEKYYMDLFLKIGGPLILLEDTVAGNAYMMEKLEEQPLYFYGMFALDELIFSNHFFCSLKYKICKVCTPHCDVSPWSNDPNKCVVANIWNWKFKLPKDVAIDT